jgi:predicted alpha/beta hydrolase
MVTTHEIAFDTADSIANVISVIDVDDSDSIILCLPAMGMAAKQYTKLLKALSEQGFSAASVDLRGNGQSSIRANRENNFGYAELAEVDLPAAIQTLKKSYPGKKLILLGHSLGGQICSLFVSQNPNLIEHLILAASCSVYYKNWPFPYRLGLLIFTQIAWLSSSILGHFPGRSIGFGGREARGIMKDWALNARTGSYSLANSKYNYDPFPKSPGLKVLAINFEDDQLAPITATDHLLSKLSATKVCKKQLTGEHIGRDRADHFNWLKSPEKIAGLIAEYLIDQARK